MFIKPFMSSVMMQKNWGVPNKMTIGKWRQHIFLVPSIKYSFRTLYVIDDWATDLTLLKIFFFLNTKLLSDVLDVRFGTRYWIISANLNISTIYTCWTIRELSVHMSTPVNFSNSVETLKSSKVWTIWQVIYILVIFQL